jgi:hypothetical protein
VSKCSFWLLICLIPAFVSLAGLPFTGPDLWLTQKGVVLFTEPFSGTGLDTNRWAAAKGIWNVEDGRLTGSELAADHHPAAIRTTVPFENAILQFDFRLDGSPGFSLSVNEEKGHHSRVVVTADGISLQKDRDKKDARSLTLPLARQNCEFKPGVWYTMTVEYCGNDLLAHINKQTFVLGRHEQMGSPKSTFGFPVRGETASFDNITVWAATPKSDAEAVKAKLLAQQTSRDSVPADPRAAAVEAETLLRNDLMQSDPAFNQLVNDRIAIDDEMHKRWPKAFQKNAAAPILRKKLLTEDADFKALNTKLAKTRKAELDYLLKQSPKLAELRKAIAAPAPSSK